MGILGAAAEVAGFLESPAKHRVLLVRTSGGVPVDISLGIPGYEEEALSGSACGWISTSSAGGSRPSDRWWTPTTRSPSSRTLGRARTALGG